MYNIVQVASAVVLEHVLDFSSMLLYFLYVLFSTCFLFSLPFLSSAFGGDSIAPAFPHLLLLLLSKLLLLDDVCGFPLISFSRLPVVLFVLYASLLLHRLTCIHFHSPGNIVEFVAHRRVVASKFPQPIRSCC